MKFEDLLERLQELDLLLDTDPKFPSVTGLIVGDAVRGSWWTHPQAKEIYRLSCALHDHPDVLAVKLISKKVTLVHRPLWPAIFTIGTAREAWQMRDLSKEALALLKKVDKAGTLASSGDTIRELEGRLLVYAESVHTEHGFHNKQVRSWEVWAKAVKLSKVKSTPGEAKDQLEGVVARINKQFGAKGTLPWWSKRRAVTRV
jgi:hypothetical protein